jgi:hypothetical protein
MFTRRLRRVLTTVARSLTGSLLFAVILSHGMAAQTTVPDRRSSFAGQWQSFDPLFPESRISLTLVQSGSSLTGRFSMVAANRNSEGPVRGTVLGARSRMEWELEPGEFGTVTFLGVLQEGNLSLDQVGETGHVHLDLTRADSVLVDSASHK